MKSLFEICLVLGFVKVVIDHRVEKFEYNFLRVVFVLIFVKSCFGFF